MDDGFASSVKGPFLFALIKTGVEIRCVCVFHSNIILNSSLRVFKKSGYICIYIIALGLQDTDYTGNFA